MNPTINAVIATQLDVARRRASDADGATARNQSWGPLHGVPMTIKEAWDWVGSASTSGSADRLDWRPERNSEAAQRLLGIAFAELMERELGGYHVPPRLRPSEHTGLRVERGGGLA